MQIGSIKQGTSLERSHFDFSHDVSTTLGFGFCQPTIIKSIVAHSKLDLSSKSIVRLAPMPVPTFGRIKFHQYNYFVPMSEVFPAFDSMESQTTVRSSIAEYIPQSADYINNFRMLNLILHNAMRYYAPVNDPKFYQSDMLRCYCTLSLSAYETKESVYSSTFKYSRTPINIYDVHETEGNFTLFDKFLKKIFETEYGAISQTMGSSAYFVDDLKNPDIPIGGAFAPLCSEMDDYRPKSLFTPKAWRSYFNKRNDVETSDFEIVFSAPHVYNYGFDEVLVDQSQSVIYRLGIHLTPFGKRLFSILNTCGVYFGCYKKVELNKLFSYYYAWFKQFNVGRDLTWKDTNCYKLIHTYYDTGITLDAMYSNPQASDYGVKSAFVDFLNDLSLCFYNLDADPITVSTPEPYNANSANDASVTLYGGKSDPDVVRNRDGQTAVETGDNYNLNSLQVQALLRLQKVVNKDSVIGKKLDDYMRLKFGYRMPTSGLIGHHDMYCQIDDTFSTVNNDTTYLGEYAGKGLGVDNSGSHVKFENEEFGYFIQFVCVVPLGGYVQAMSPVEIDRLDFHRSEYDSLGMEPLPMSEVLGRTSVLPQAHSDTVFGFRPRFFSKKYMNNLHNGGFAFRSERGEFLPYCLDRVFSEREVDYSAGLPETSYFPPANTEALRSIGLYEFYGNYDRMFYDTTGQSSNFIVHMVNDFHVYSPMKAIANSFDCFDPETDNGSSAVEHV